MLGQDQDQRGEGFNPAESFVGSISQLNIWDHVLSPEEVNACSEFWLAEGKGTNQC